MGTLDLELIVLKVADKVFTMIALLRYAWHAIVDVKLVYLLLNVHNVWIQHFLPLEEFVRKLAQLELT